MKTISSFKCSLLLLSGVLLVVSSPLAAQGTFAEREACTPDVFRLCSSFIPDPVPITVCLRKRKADLSDACRRVVFSPARSDIEGARRTPRSQSFQ